MDVDPSGLRTFMNWYDDKHGPDTLSVGFYTAQAYHCRIGTPFVMNVYEIESSEVFYTDEYQHMRTPESDPERPAILAGVSNRSNTVYEQVATDGVDVSDQLWSGGSRVGGVDSPTIATWRFECDLGRDAMVKLFLSDLQPFLAATTGYASSRLCRQAGRLHPANPSAEPMWTIVSEWTQLDADGAKRLEALLDSVDSIDNAAAPFNVGVRVTRLVS
jgi:hypothetical protein